MRYLSHLALAALFVFAVFAGPVASLALAAPRTAEGPFVVVARKPGTVVADAGGRVFGPVSAPFAVFAEGDDDFMGRLNAAGAWAVLDADRLAALCAVFEE